MVIVPALNEEDAIARVVLDGRETLGADVVVIDDGSSDRPGSRAKAAGASIGSLPYNLGVGGATFHWDRVLAPVARVAPGPFGTPPRAAPAGAAPPRAARVRRALRRALRGVTPR